MTVVSPRNSETPGATPGAVATSTRATTLLVMEGRAHVIP